MTNKYMIIFDVKCTKPPWENIYSSVPELHFSSIDWDVVRRVDLDLQVCLSLRRIVYSDHMLVWVPTNLDKSKAKMVAYKIILLGWTWRIYKTSCYYQYSCIWQVLCLGISGRDILRTLLGLLTSIIADRLEALSNR